MTLELLIPHCLFFVNIWRARREFDPHAALAALEQLVDAARDKVDDRASRFSVILRQTRPLLFDPSFQQLLLKLVGDKEEVAIANEIQKALKRSLPPYPPREERPRFNPYPRRQPLCVSPVEDAVISLGHAIPGLGAFPATVNRIEKGVSPGTVAFWHY